MRKIRGLLLPALFLCSAAWAAQTYTHPKYLYAVDYPDSWTLRELGGAITLSAPREDEDDKFSENVQIIAEDLSSALQTPTLIEYHRTGLANAEKFLTDFKPLEEARTEWLGRETLVMLYTASVRGEKYRFKDYKFIEGHTAYVLTYTARAADFDTFLEKAEAVMSSLRVSP